MLFGHLKNQKGATLVLVAAFMLGALGITGLVVDVGNLYMEKSRMQTGVDLSSLTGANNFPDNARAAATASLTANRQNLPGSITTIDDNTTGELSTLTVTLTRAVPTFIMGIFGVRTVDITVRGVAQSAEEASQYTIYSNNNLTFQPATNIAGSVYSGGNITFAGNALSTAIAGDADAFGTIAPDLQVVPLSEHGGNKHPGVTKPMPVFPGLTITGTPITTSGTIRREQLNAGINVHAEAGTKIILTLNNYTGPGGINISGAGDVEIRGITHIIGSIHSSGTGRVTIHNASFNITGEIYVPHGTVIMEGSSFTIGGSLVANDIVFTEAANNFNGPTGDAAFRRHARLVG